MVARIIEDDELKKHSRTSPEIQSKELNEKIRITIRDQQINLAMPAKTQTKSSPKVEKLKQSVKLNKNILIAKTLEAFNPKAKFDRLRNYLYQKIAKSQFLSLKLIRYYICKT